MMGDMLAQQGDLEGAALKFQALARLCEVQNEIAAAIQYMRKVIELTPTDLSPRSRLIELLIASGGAVEAIEEYIQLAEVYQSMADGAAARRVCEQGERGQEPPHSAQARGAGEGGQACWWWQTACGCFAAHRWS